MQIVMMYGRVGGDEKSSLHVRVEDSGLELGWFPCRGALRALSGHVFIVCI